jgi:hypothetical protein
MANADLAAPGLEFIFAGSVTVGAPLDVGQLGKGARRIVPITGGAFCGPALQATVLADGADWQIIRDDGVAELEARYLLRADDGALIAVRNLALRHGPAATMAALAAGQEVDPALYYFRGTAFFESGSARYAWMARHIIVCTGKRDPQTVVLKFFRLT